MKESIELKAEFNVEPAEIYKAWLNGELHSEMTGGQATCNPKINGDFTAWDGYIFGKNIALNDASKIVQTWRTTEFDDKDEDSELTIHLQPTKNGTQLTLIHTNIPSGQTQYEKGWLEHYIEPMKAYFNQ